MKKYLVVALALAVALSLGAPAMAKDGLSVGLSFGLLPNAAGLGSAIVTDGLDKNVDVDGPANTTGYDTLTLIPAEKDMLDDETSGTYKDVETNGAHDSHGPRPCASLRLPGLSFFKTGYNYSFKVMGGESSFEWDAITVDKNSYKWDYQAWHIPFTLGLNLPILEGKLNLYMGLTAAYMSGYWECDV